MTISDFGRSGLALLMSPSGTIPSFLAIGSGSGAEVATLGSLLAEVLSARTNFSTRDITVAREVSWIFDINSTSMSGIDLKEFGIGQVVTKGTNDLWNRESLVSVTFDGTKELQVEIRFEVF